MLKKIFGLVLVILGLTSLTGCQENKKEPTISEKTSNDNIEDLGEDSSSFGDSLDDSGIYDGIFEGESDLNVNFVSGTNNAYSIENNTLTFTNITSDSVYSISGKLRGNIVINISENFKLDLELNGFSLISDSYNPIMISSGNKVTLKAKNNSKNYIYDERQAVEDNDDTTSKASIISLCDLQINGKGNLNVVSKNNNGIHSKDDLTINNLTLVVACSDNAIKGNDSVTIDDANVTGIASLGDAIKTKNSNISDKGNQKGNVTINSGTINLYSAEDGIDAAHNVVINGGNLNIFTDKYSNYSSSISSNNEGTYYLKTTSNTSKYSIKYINNENDYVWLDAEYKTSYREGKNTYYYYTFDKNSNYNKLVVYTYNQNQESNQDNDFVYESEILTINTSFDTLQINANSYSWTNYTTESRPGGFGGPGGGMNDGNTDKKDTSTKGIKSENEIIINNGKINIKSYDDSIHTNNDSELENGIPPTGNIIINNGIITIYSNDDGIHSSGSLTINNGNINIVNCYEGLEGSVLNFNEGNLSIFSKDDGINSTLTTGETINLNGGKIYINSGGDGIDSNSRTSYSGIIFNGADVVVISSSGMNSAIDTESGYKYINGRVLAVMPSGGMSNEATHCQNFNNYGIKSSLTINENTYITIDDVLVVKSSLSMNSLIIYLGDNSVKINAINQSNQILDNNGVYWK